MLFNQFLYKRKICCAFQLWTWKRNDHRIVLQLNSWLYWISFKILHLFSFIMFAFSSALSPSTFLIFLQKKKKTEKNVSLYCMYVHEQSISILHKNVSMLSLCLQFVLTVNIPFFFLPFDFNLFFFFLFFLFYRIRIVYFTILFWYFNGKITNNMKVKIIDDIKALWFVWLRNKQEWPKARGNQILIKMWIRSKYRITMNETSELLYKFVKNCLLNKQSPERAFLYLSTETLSAIIANLDFNFFFSITRENVFYPQKKSCSDFRTRQKRTAENRTKSNFLISQTYQNT